jgi:hypothetical protein
MTACPSSQIDWSNKFRFRDSFSEIFRLIRTGTLEMTKIKEAVERGTPIPHGCRGGGIGPVFLSISSSQAISSYTRENFRLSYRLKGSSDLSGM